MDRKSLLRNAALVGLAGSVESALGLAAGVVIARALGPAEYGHYAYSIWLCGLMILLVNHGLPQTSIKFLAEVRGSHGERDAGHVLWRMRRVHFASALAVLCAFVVADLLVPIDDWKDAALPMLAISVVAIWARADFRAQAAFGKGYERFSPENTVVIVMAPLSLVIVAALALTSASVLNFFALYAVVGVLSCLLARRLLRREGVLAQPGDMSTELQQRMRTHLLLTGLIVFLFALTNRAVEMTLLKAHTDTATVGYFAIASSLTKGALDVLAGGMSAVLLPAMSRRYGQGGAVGMGRLVAESTRMYWFVGLAIAGFGLTLTEGAVNLLYGARYSAVVPALTFMLVVSGLLVVNGASSAALSASDKQFDRIRIMIVTLLLNMGLGWWLIPRYGLTGALLSMGVTQVFEAALAAWRVRRHTTVPLPMGPMARATAAAAMAALLGWTVTWWLGSAYGFILGAVTFSLVYAGLCVMFRTLRDNELELISGISMRFGHPGAALGRLLLKLRPRFGISG